MSNEECRHGRAWNLSCHRCRADRRERIARAALVGLLANEAINAGDAAHLAAVYADALIAELGEP